MSSGLDASTVDLVARAMRTRDSWDTATPKQQAQYRTYAERALTALADAGLLPASGETVEALVDAVSGHPLEGVWNAAVDAVTSRGFRLPDGELDEVKYLRYKRRVLGETTTRLGLR